MKRFAKDPLDTLLDFLESSNRGGKRGGTSDKDGKECLSQDVDQT